MTKISKKAELWIVTLICVFLLGGIIHVDWARFFHKDRIRERHVYSDRAKLMIALLLMITALRAPKNPFRSGLRRYYIPVAFCLIMLAESFFKIFKEPKKAIVTFGIVQLVLSAGHLQGAKTEAGREGLRQHRGQLIAIAVAASCVVLFMQWFVWYPRIGLKYPFPLLSAYFPTLIVSLVSAHASRFIGTLPKTTANVAAAAMTCFFICDNMVTVGLVARKPQENGDDPERNLYIIFTSSTWIFYGPALLLLLWSGHPAELDAATVVENEKKRR